MWSSWFMRAGSNSCICSKIPHWPEKISALHTVNKSCFLPFRVVSALLHMETLNTGGQHWNSNVSDLKTSKQVSSFKWQEEVKPGRAISSWHLSPLIRWRTASVAVGLLSENQVCEHWQSRLSPPSSMTTVPLVLRKQDFTPKPNTRPLLNLAS